MISSSCSVQNPNPDTKSFEKNQRNASESTTRVNRSESLPFYNDFTQKTKDPNSSNLNHQDSKVHIVLTMKITFFCMIRV